MSESEFLLRQAREFRERHPAEEGWLLLRTDPDFHPELERLLPVFLKTEAPEALVRGDIQIDIAWADGKDGPRGQWSERPFRPRGAGIDDTDWYGELELVWRGSPIHYLRWVKLGTFHDQPLTLAAVKARPALEELWRRLKRFKRRYDRVHRTIELLGEGVIDRPPARWEELLLAPAMAVELRRTVESFRDAKRHYLELGLPYRRGLLFTGPPGCGKTTAVRTIAANHAGGVYLLPLKAKTEDYEVRRAFKTAAENAPALLILEDLDRLANHEKVSMSYLLNQLDGIKALEGVLVVATTNHPEKLDQALLHRPSRFDRVFHFGLPGYAERLALLLLRARGRFSRTGCEEAARRTEGFTMAYVQEVVMDALLRCLHEGRAFRDEELYDSALRLKDQQKSSARTNGEIPRQDAVGFALGEAAGR